MVDLDIMRSVRERQNEVYGALRTVFYEADVNNDGCLTLQEFKDVGDENRIKNLKFIFCIFFHDFAPFSYLKQF